MLWLPIVLVFAGPLAQPLGGGLSPIEGAVVFARDQVAQLRVWQIAGDQGLTAVGLSGEKINLTGKDLLCLDAGITSLPNPVSHVVLRNGESINARLAAGSTGQRLVFESPLLGKLQVLAKDVARYQADPPVQGNDRAAPPFILLKNGDLLATAVEKVIADRVSVNTEFGETQIPLETVAAIVLSAAEPPFDGRGDNQILVELVDGQRLYCDRVTQDAGRVVLTRDKTDCSVDTSAVQRLVWPGATIAHLSDRPSKSEGHSYFGSPAEPRKNHNALGGPLRIGSSWFSRGLGMRPRSRCLFQSDSSWLYLAGYTGMDPLLGRRGNCEIAVNVDGKPAMKHSLEGGQPIRRLLVPVSGAGQIELQVDFGPDGDLGDYVNWCDLLLVGRRPTGSREAGKSQSKTNSIEAQRETALATTGRNASGGADRP